VQTSPTAAEELSRRQEISRQVAQSANIASRASTMLARTTPSCAPLCRGGWRDLTWADTDRRRGTALAGARRVERDRSVCPRTVRNEFRQRCSESRSRRSRKGAHDGVGTASIVDGAARDIGGLCDLAADFADRRGQFFRARWRPFARARWPPPRPCPQPSPGWLVRSAVPVIDCAVASSSFDSGPSIRQAGLRTRRIDWRGRSAPHASRSRLLLRGYLLGFKLPRRDGRLPQHLQRFAMRPISSPRSVSPTASSSDPPAMRCIRSSADRALPGCRGRPSTTAMPSAQDAAPIAPRRSSNAFTSASRSSNRGHS